MSSNSESKTQNVQRPTIFTFPLFDGVTAIKIATNVRQREASERNREKVVIALDRSGSMHYVMSDVCEASVKIIRSLFDAKKTDVGFVAYNYETRWVDINPSNFLNTATAIKQIRPGGQTGFAILLTTIYSYLENVPADRPVTIFILTDGCETCSSQSEVNNSMKELRKLFESRSGRSRVVTLGFTNRHDANFLTTLSNLGTHPGFFAYSENSSDLSSTMNLVEKIMSINTIDGTLRIVAGGGARGESADEKVTLLPSADGKTMEGYVFAPETKEGTYILQLGDGDEKFADVVVPVEIEPEMADILEARVTYFSENLKVAARQADGAMARQLHKQLGRSRQDAFKVRDRGRRRKIMQDCLVIAASLDEVLAHFAKGSGARLDNAQLAKITSLAYKGGKWKAATQRKMNVRKDKNAKLFNDIEGKIKSAVESIDFSELDQHQDALSDTCIYSCLDWVDALKDGDCLGIALDVGRSEAAIHDPTQFTIKKIQPSFITGNSFMDALEYAMDNSYDSKAVHGGFDRRQQGHVIPGVARESITGMLPLYFNKEHWKVARHQMKCILGWMVTLDPMGYTASQYTTVPFLVLAKAAQDTSTNGKRVFRLVADTCQKIYGDWKGIGEKVKEVFEKYVDDPAVRTIDQVPHQAVFLGQLFCALRAGDVKFENADQAREFWMAFVEETVRRGVSIKNREIQDTVSFCSFFGINVEEFVRPYIELTMRDAKESYTGVSAKTQQIRQAFPDVFANLDSANPFCNREAKDEQKEISFSLPWEKEDSYRMSSVAKRNLKITEDAYEWCTKTSIPALWKKMVLVPDLKEGEIRTVFTQELPEKLEDMPGMSVGASRLAFAYQTVNQKDNAKRRAAIEKKDYLWMWDDQFDSKRWLKEESEVALEKERREAVSEALNRFKTQTDGREGDLFASSRDLAECVGLLQGRYHGANLQPFWEALGKKVCPLAGEKLGMILSGQYKGIPLICDKYKSKSKDSDCVEWYPDQAHARRFYFNIGLRTGMTPDEWCLQFPQTAQHVQPLVGKSLQFDPTKL